PSEQLHAMLVLSLLLNRRGDAPADITLDWPLLLALAQQNTVLVLVADRIQLAGLEPPTFFVAAADRERERTRTVFGVMQRLGERCEEAGLAYLFPTAWQHFPDVGGDLDLLLLSQSPDVDAVILEGTAAPLLQHRRCGRDRERGAGAAARLDVPGERGAPDGRAPRAVLLPGLRGSDLRRAVRAPSPASGGAKPPHARWLGRSGVPAGAVP